jgi:hypothetical protein
LSKFGLDEVEVFTSKGLSDSTAKEILSASAGELLRVGHSPKVGTSLILPQLSRVVHISNYRTAAPAGRMLGFRELKTS